MSRRVARSGLADEGTTPEIQNIGKYTALTRGILKGNSVKHNASKLYPEYKVRRHATEFFARGKVSLTVKGLTNGMLIILLLGLQSPLARNARSV